MFVLITYSILFIWEKYKYNTEEKMRKNIVKLLLFAMILCFTGCNEEEKVETETPISDPDAFVADLYNNDKESEKDNEKDKDNDEEESEKESETEPPTDYVDNDDEDDYEYDYDFSGSDSSNINTTGLEYNGSVLYKSDGYIFFADQYCTKAYLSSDFSEAMGIFSYTVPSYAETMKDEFYDYVFETLEENYGELTKKGSFVNAHEHEFEVFEYKTTEGNYGIIYLALEGDTSAAVIGSSIYSSMSSQFTDVLNSVIIQ